MKGIILAGGKATRLYPVTKAVCKQLLPLYDKPMIYYSLSVLMLAGIRDILLIVTQRDLPLFQKLFGDGSKLGLSLEYAVQSKPGGIAESFVIGERFIGDSRVALILGDNVFYGHQMTQALKEATDMKKGAYVFGYYVRDPERYGVIDFDKKFRVTSIVEKPKKPRSNWAVTGLYFYDSSVVRLAKNLKPSKRGELEITDINRIYLKRKQLHVKLLGRGYAWLDTGTHDSLMDASAFIKTIEDRQGLKVGCIEEIAYRMGFINKSQMKSLASSAVASYGHYLREVLHEKV